MRTVEFGFWVRASLEAVWAFHSDPENLPRIMPGPMRVMAWDRPMRAGSAVSLMIGLGRLGVAWRLRVREHQPMLRFVDVQEHGPFRSWVHEHSFHADTHGAEQRPGETKVCDRITFALPLGAITEPVFAALMRLSFVQRQRQTRALLER